MGMYTELIFGASLKEDTPKEVLSTINYILGNSNKPENFPLPEGRCESLFRHSSYYFGVSKPVNSFIFDDISNCWILSIRCNVKNYNNEIETFLTWIKPYIDNGSGVNNIYAITIFEEDSSPIIYSL